MILWNSSNSCSLLDSHICCGCHHAQLTLFMLFHVPNIIFISESSTCFSGNLLLQMSCGEISYFRWWMFTYIDFYLILAHFFQVDPYICFYVINCRLCIKSQFFLCLTLVAEVFWIWRTTTVRMQTKWKTHWYLIPLSYVR